MDSKTTKITSMEILIIIFFSLICTIIMDHLNAYERLQLFIIEKNISVFDEFIVFFPAFIAMGFILFSTKRVQELGLEIKRRQDAEAALLESEKSYRELSITDELTGLFNQRHFFHCVKAEIDRSKRYAKSLSLILLDVDDFKIFNDTYGHLDGDKVLKEIGRIIHSVIRSADSAFRYGGEEFVVIMPETSGSSAHTVAERIRAGFKNHAFTTHNDATEHLTLSLGVAEYLPGEDTHSFVNRADVNMYTAKKKGKDQIHYSRNDPGLKNAIGF
jgi:diguanylate cyclase (GGDEF)-like protein